MKYLAQQQRSIQGVMCSRKVILAAPVWNKAQFTHCPQHPEQVSEEALRDTLHLDRPIYAKIQKLRDTKRQKFKDIQNTNDKKSLNHKSILTNPLD